MVIQVGGKVLQHLAAGHPSGKRMAEEPVIEISSCKAFQERPELCPGLLPTARDFRQSRQGIGMGGRCARRHLKKLVGAEGLVERFDL
jgi:hypothetical protein